MRRKWNSQITLVFLTLIEILDCPWTLGKGEETFSGSFWCKKLKSSSPSVYDSAVFDSYPRKWLVAVPWTSYPPIEEKRKLEITEIVGSEFFSDGWIVNGVKSLKCNRCRKFSTCLPKSVSKKAAGAHLYYFAPKKTGLIKVNSYHSYWLWHPVFTAVQHKLYSKFQVTFMTNRDKHRLLASIVCQHSL